MTFTSRLIILSVVAVLAAIAAVSAVAFEVRARIDAAIDETRVSHLLGSLQATGQANLDIGLALDQIGLLQARIEREKAGDPAILGIDVFDAQGHPLYTTDRGSLGEPVPDGWLVHLDDPGVWHTADRGDQTFGVRFENDLGKPVGGIALTIAEAGRSRSALEWGLIIAAHAMIAALGAAVLAGIAAFLYGRRATRPFVQAAVLLHDPAAAAGRPALAFDAGALAARAAWVEADAAVSAGLERLGALDDVG
ncbi:hypothetical protein [Ancylobacter terrae]|uniref:hypothetical protein n=1 Tax=Ancylobacter sp. sgz301288 TaxID=3342077 RepID=UPI00385F3FAF